ncbi:Sm-like protein LSM7 [Camellia lanceoleosa]|nr:Sm-like protein LSM7 [Camellia lanceoleosa]
MLSSLLICLSGYCVVCTSAAGPNLLLKKLCDSEIHRFSSVSVKQNFRLEFRLEFRDSQIQIGEVCRGTAVMLVSPTDGTDEIANPFIQLDGA